ncbi:mannosyl-3-phosphoglycerate phosphatase [Salinisphaera sp. Q1T1-3]|uniref:HAD-IIB family hydrolase n=1 Tax=Salinisphaera sp. Q1T1-3 TaxID=2321229 RepID=UPI001313D9F7|nr:HAD-IIB family hydrolase [Salinisphaera sp. Q1T1-3]
MSTKRAVRAVVFTDLDATLLDHDSYDWSAAQDALEALKSRGVPVCLCTSKTVAEVRALRRALGNRAPFATENGSIVAVPDGYFEGEFANDSEAEETLTCTTLGAPYDRLRRLVVDLRARHGFDYTGFGDMSVADVMAATGLDREAAAAARQRDASEPLLWQDSAAAETAFAQAVAEAGATTRRGGRFVHVLGLADKGDALDWLRTRFEAVHGPILAVALGDSANDADMLAAADIGWWVARPDGDYEAPAGGHIRHAEGIGPVGWSAAIHAMIEAGEI